MSKFLTAAAFALTAGTATIASAASNYVTTVDEPQFESTYVNLDVVRADSDAIVTIYDYRLGEQGAVLGTAPVQAGANGNVKVNLNDKIKGDVLAVISSGNDVLATERLSVKVR
ncbi:hypothetical protein SAMN05421688_3462 [Poseidonocella pacifica]|uniref:Uncharacterized protein n=1 Tax=Poseidonocella pacifica TaxID=871651 RepID=A0A1I0YYG4_9RHOB|nr:hypothetical protein [Poseidonocella pacifica]SFB18077.1 hypothetical protein SAMN05421688_3462 [Poseidonocella pacifica]